MCYDIVDLAINNINSNNKTNQLYQKRIISINSIRESKNLPTTMPAMIITIIPVNKKNTLNINVVYLQHAVDVGILLIRSIFYTDS